MLLPTFFYRAYQKGTPEKFNHALTVATITGWSTASYLWRHENRWASVFKMSPDDANIDRIYCREVREILSR